MNAATVIPAEDAMSRDKASRLVAESSRIASDALLANPLLDFDRLLLVRRRADAPRLGLPHNWESNCVLPRAGYGNDLAVLAPVSPAGTLATLYRPDDDAFVGDVELLQQVRVDEAVDGQRQRAVAEAEREPVRRLRRLDAEPSPYVIEERQPEKAGVALIHKSKKIGYLLA